MATSNIVLSENSKNVLSEQNRAAGTPFKNLGAPRTVGVEENFPSYPDTDMLTWVGTFYLDMESSQCGYPLCCPGKQPNFVELNFFPRQS